MKKLTIVLAVLLSSLLLACGPKSIPKHQLTYRAPMSADSVGVTVVGVSEGELASYVEKNEHMQVRVINPNHNVYEVFGATEESLKNAFDSNEGVEVWKNSFVPLNAAGEKSRDLQTLRAELSKKFQSEESDRADKFLETCEMDLSKSPKVVLNSNVPVDRFQYRITELGSGDVTYSSKNSIDRNGLPVIEAMWLMMPPSDSLGQPEILFDVDPTVAPDTSGEYDIRIVVKDSEGFCGYQLAPLFVEENIKYSSDRALQVSDRSRFSLAHFWHLEHVDAETSWLHSEGEGVLVAVIDSGINYNNPYLAANIYVNSNEIPDNQIDDDNNGFIDDAYGYDIGASDPYAFDESGHGSHVAGLVASPIFGLAPKAKILPVKVGGGAGIDLASVVGGIYYSVDMGADVINLSLGSSKDFPEEKLALEYAEKHGVLVVAAAGNGDKQGKSMNNDIYGMFPANYKMSNLISVASTSRENKLSSYSNFGKNTVHLAAPGGDGDHLMNSAYKKNPRNVNLVGMAGTSMAAPVVAGIGAQLLSLYPELLPHEARSTLMGTGTAVESLNGLLISNRIVHSRRALESLGETKSHVAAVSK